MTAAIALVVAALVLAVPVPRALARAAFLRRDPAGALVVWQSVTLAAIVSAAAAAPAVLVAASPGAGVDPLSLAVAAVTAAILGRLLWSGHRVGTRLRAARRRHRELVDVIARPGDDVDEWLRVLAHETPTAYCVPGLRHRVVLSQGTLEALTGEEVRAVLAHERAHLTARHDLVLEFFTVTHEAVPRGVRCPSALHEVRLLVEVLADRAAARRAGVITTARALVALAGGHAPEATLGMGQVRTARIRLDLLSEALRPHPGLRLACALLSLGALSLPVSLLLLASV